MIEIKQLVKAFDDGTEALKDINLHLNQGELTCIIGPSGCGKTTLLKHINRLISPSDGDILIDGVSIYEKDVVELRRSIGYVIQQIGLFPHMTIAENISVVPKLLNWSKANIDQRVDEMLNMVNLEPETYRERFPLELSGGQQQRVGVARALVGDPDIILMDEPFSALDPISREQLQDQLKELHKQLKKTIVFVTHDMDEALKIADRIVILRKGELEQLGTPDDILQSPQTDFVKSFIGKERMNRFLKTSQRRVKYFEGWLLSNSPGGKQKDIDASEELDSLTELFVDQKHEVAVVKEDDKVLGYLTKDIFLKALASERGEES